MKVSTPTAEEDVLMLYGLYQKSREKTVTPAVLAEYWREHQKKDQGEAELFPEITEPEELYQDQDIYAEIGMDPIHSVIKGRKRAEKSETPRLPQKSVQKEKPLLLEKSGGKQSGTNLFSKWKERALPFLKAHVPEAIIAAVVVIGAILIVLS